MDKRRISNTASYFQVIKSTVNVSADSEQKLGENIVLNKSPIEIRVPDKPFHPNDSYVFPKRVFGKQNRFCNSKWFKLYPIVSNVLFVSAITQNQKEMLKSLLHQQVIQIGNMLFLRLMNTELQVIID